MSSSTLSPALMTNTQVVDKPSHRCFCQSTNQPTCNQVLTSGGASFSEWGGQRGANTFSGGKCIWLPITHFHNTGHILHYSKYPSLSLDLSFLFASCDSFPFHLSFIPISRPSPPLIQLGVWGSAVSSPSGEPGRQMDFGEFWA